MPVLSGRMLLALGGIAFLSALLAFALGYWRGARAAASTPAVVEKRTETDKRTEADKTQQISRSASVNTDEDVVEVRTTAPARTLADGSVEVQTRIRRGTAKSETEVSSVASKERVVEKVVEVEKVVAVPGPAAAPAPLPRWMAGPSVSRDFSLSKTLFGGSLAVRTGPVWWRVFADSHPQAGVAAEVFW